MARTIIARWRRLWMRLAGTGRLGRLANCLAGIGMPGYKARYALAQIGPRGYIAPSAELQHPGLRLGKHSFIGERVVIYGHQGAGPVELAEAARINQETIIEVGAGGCVSIGPRSTIQARCQISAFAAAVRIGAGVQIAPNCAFYPYDHGSAPGQAISAQPLTTRGDIEIGDDAWLGYGVIILSGVRIGAGAIVGAGAVVTRSIPDGAIAAGTPARVIRLRDSATGISAPQLNQSEGAT